MRWKVAAITTSVAVGGSVSPVVVDDENSSEVWSSFRVARRAYPHDFEIKKYTCGTNISCAHDGYNRLAGKPIHRRHWEFSECNLVVRDKIEGSFDTAFAYFHLHPSITVSNVGPFEWILYLPEGKLVTIKAEADGAEWISSYYAFEFGKRISKQCLKLKLAISGCRINIDWS